MTRWIAGICLVCLFLQNGCDRGRETDVAEVPDLRPAPEKAPISTPRPTASGRTWRDAVGFTIAIDSGATHSYYMRAAKRRGIPSAFLIGPSGHVEWIGHPGALDEPLAELLEQGSIRDSLQRDPEPGATLRVGDQAPPLDIAEWIEGTPIDRFEPDRLYVVEFWATWCGPCRQSIPHLTTLQEKYRDDLTVISITDEERKTVERFLGRVR